MQRPTRKTLLCQTDSASLSTAPGDDASTPRVLQLGTVPRSFPSEEAPLAMYDAESSPSDAPDPPSVTILASVWQRIGDTPLRSMTSTASKVKRSEIDLRHLPDLAGYAMSSVDACRAPAQVTTTIVTYQRCCLDCTVVAATLQCRVGRCFHADKRCSAPIRPLRGELVGGVVGVGALVRCASEDTMSCRLSPRI